MAAKFRNVSDVPLAVAVFLASDNYDHSEESNTISATSLLRSTRQYILGTRINPNAGMTDLMEQVKNRLGAAIHDSIENAWVNNHTKAMDALGFPKRLIDRILVNPKLEELTADSIPIYLEQRVGKKIGIWNVTGKYDFVGEGYVQDFKTTSTYSYTKQVNADKYILQGSIYKWLNPDIVTQSEMLIHYIFTDWKASFNNTPEYPSKPVLTQRFPLLSVQDTEQYIVNKLNEIDRYINAPESELPLCSDDDLWRSEPVYKYYKNPSNIIGRSTKNFSSYTDAAMRLNADGNVGVVLTVPGEAKACKYCKAFSLCTQKDALIASGDLNFKESK